MFCAAAAFSAPPPAEATHETPAASAPVGSAPQGAEEAAAAGIQRGVDDIELEVTKKTDSDGDPP